MDPYKSLLASASREHVHRSSALQSPLVGNVFLPAIQSPKRPALHESGALQHLKVIEQCIQAENRREATLAQCQSERERRRWTRKFQAQREHEKQLIEALMIPATKAAGLELLDLDAGMEAPSVGRVMNTMSGRLSVEEDAGVGGLTSSVSSPDRVFRKAKASSTLTTTTAARPHARTKFLLPECNGSPGKKTFQAQTSVYISSGDGRAKDPPGRQRSPSRSASPVRTGSMLSPSSKATAPPSKAQGSSVDKRKVIDSKEERNATSKTRVPPLKSASKPQALVSPARKSSGGRLRQVVTQKQVKVDETDSVTLLDGARSFAEVQRLALEAAGMSGVNGEEKETQTTSRGEAADKWATPSTGSRSVLPDDRIPDEGDRQDISEQQLPVRPHSSPLMRSPSSLGCHREDGKTQRVAESNELAPPVDTLTQELEPQVDPSIQSEANAGVVADELEDEEAGDPEGVATAKGATEIQVDKDDQQQEERAEADQADKADVLFTCTTEDRATEEKSAGNAEDLLEAAASLEANPDEMVEVEDLDGVDNGHAEDDESSSQEEIIGDAQVPARVDEDELETDVAEVLFDLVDLVADAVEQQQLQVLHVRSDAPVNTRSTPPPRPSTADTARSAALVRHLVRIQALFRGHNSRRAFRLALYQESLRCGMLGAMPGTVQGASGWYQDPKSLVAYYFVVDAATGEWVQQRELRCQRLVLTPFAMRAELLAAESAPS